MNVFKSCPYNSRILYQTSLKEHTCLPCGNLTPVSFGFAYDLCYTCRKLSVSLAEDLLDRIDKYAYTAGCLGGVDGEDEGRLELDWFNEQ